MHTMLTRLTDDALIASLRALSARSHEIEADIIVHLIEVEDRRLHLERAYPSMFAFCTACLGFSEGAAYNRIEVARAARKVPAMLASLRSGDIHLTGLRLLAPHLTEENHTLVLQRAKRRTKQEIAEIVAELAPKTPVSDAVRKLPEKKAAGRRDPITPQGPKPASVPASTPPQLELRAARDRRSRQVLQANLRIFDAWTHQPSADHSARSIWAMVERLDLSGLHAQIEARDLIAGAPAIDPKILLSLDLATCRWPPRRTRRGYRGLLGDEPRERQGREHRDGRADRNAHWAAPERAPRRRRVRLARSDRRGGGEIVGSRRCQCAASRRRSRSCRSSG